MKMLLVAAGVALLSSPAIGQPRPPNSVNLNATVTARSEACAGADFLIFSCSFGEHRAALAAVAARELRSKVGNLIADGKCDEARTTALRAGDFDLAAQANAFCRPSAPAPSAAQ